jgi:hypothetical protein
MRDKGLLLHARLRSQRAGNIMQITHLISLVGGKGDRSFRQKYLHLITARRFGGIDSSLCHQRGLELGRQLFSPFIRSP